MIPQQAINEYRVLYLEQYEDGLTHEEAEEHVSTLLQLYEAVLF